MKETWIFPLQSIFAFHVILRISNGYFPKQHQATRFAVMKQCPFVQFEQIFVNVV
jgi:hypothetical protein